MARITIKRPNGSMEYAELTTDRSLAGNDRLVVMKNGTTHYAKLDTGVSTHMYVVKNGRKLYVQKEVAFQWSFYIAGRDYNFVVPRTGTYRLEYEDYTKFNDERKPDERTEGVMELRLSAGDRPEEGSVSHNDWLLGGKMIGYYIGYGEGEPEYEDGIEREGRDAIRITYLHD